MWIVRLTDQRTSYGPFTDPELAQRFANFLTVEVDLAAVEKLHNPASELLNWRDAMHAGGHLRGRPSVRGGPDIGHAADHDYRHQEQNDRD